MDFLWHRVSEKEREKIKEEAERIMESFSKRLEEFDGDVGNLDSENGNFEREEGQETPADIDREIMFSNAPNKAGDSIIAEKGDW